MKRKLILFVVFIMLVSLCSCGKIEDIRGDISQGDDNKVGSSVTPDEEKEFSMGSVDGLKYENAFIGIGCNLDSEWTFYTDEQIMELNNITSDFYSEDVKDILENADVVYDMFAINSNMIDNIVVNLEKINPVQLAVTDIAKSLDETMTYVEETYKNMGFTDFTYNITTVDIDGQEFTAVKAKASADGGEMYQVMFAKKCNGYLASVAITSLSEESLSEVLDCFYIVK